MTCKLHPELSDNCPLIHLDSQIKPKDTSWSSAQPNAGHSVSTVGPLWNLQVHYRFHGSHPQTLS
jgi:hypothetical protein